MRFLVAIDLWDPTLALDAFLDPVVPWAARTGATLDLLTTRPREVFPPWHEVPAELVGALHAQWQQVERDARDRLDAALASIPEAHRGAVRVEAGDPWTELASYAVGYDLAILATHGRTGLARAWSGSVTERFVARSPVPTLVLHRDRPAVGPGPLRAVAAVDLAEPATPQLATWAARLRPVTIDALYVQAAPLAPASTEGASPMWLLEDQAALQRAHRDRLAAELAALPADTRGGIDVRIGAPASEIVDAAGAADLVIVGTHGRTGLAHVWYGSVAERVVRRAGCPVLVLPGG
jgi:nucleotide-binding universal stress UspA family protein